jgi:DNA-binding NarL/FixJ family response regulator
VRLNVAIAADSEVTLRHAMLALDAEEFDIALCETDFDRFITWLRAHDLPSVVVLAQSGARVSAAARTVRAIDADVPIVVISEPRGWSGLRRILDEGADGFVALGDIDARLALTVHAVYAGHAAIPRPDTPTINVDALSTREKQVLGMVVMGFSNGEIARTLHLAESTIKSHLSCVFTKLGVNSRNDAAALILDPHDGPGPGVLAITGG